MNVFWLHSLPIIHCVSLHPRRIIPLVPADNGCRHPCTCLNCSILFYRIFYAPSPLLPCPFFPLFWALYWTRSFQRIRLLNCTLEQHVSPHPLVGSPPRVLISTSEGGHRLLANTKLHQSGDTSSRRSYHCGRLHDLKCCSWGNPVLHGQVYHRKDPLQRDLASDGTGTSSGTLLIMAVVC